MNPKWKSKHKSVNDRIQITIGDCKKCEQVVSLRAVKRTMILTIAYLMDEKEFDFDEDRLLQVWDGLSRYSQAVMDKTISMNKVCEIISEHTGMRITWDD